MFRTTVPILALVVLSSLWRVHADGTVLGVDVYGDTILSFNFTLPITTATTATAPDTTITGNQIVVLGSTHMHAVEVMTIGSETVTFIDDCPINVTDGPDSMPDCTLAELKQTTTILTVVSFTQAASRIPTTTATLSAAPKSDGARRPVGVAGAAVLVGIAAGVALAGGIA